MDIMEIRNKVKEVIARTANIDPADIGDAASFKEDLGLDSLTMLEIGVNVDYEFGLRLPDEEATALRTVEDAVAMVQKHMFPKVDG